MRFMILPLFFLIACQSSPDSQQGEPQTIAQAEPVAQEVIDTVSPPEYVFSKDFLMGKFDPATHPDFARIESQYTNKDEIYMHGQAYEAFLKMYAAAKQDGINLQIRSAARNFDYQKGIWERKWTGVTKVGGQDLSKTVPDPADRARKILEYSSMPGTSRHHWGTDIDFNSFDNSYFESGKGLEEYEWLVANAGKFGFCQVYSEKGPDRPYGYNLEKWHWSWLPLAKKLTAEAKAQLSDSDIEGFKGAETAPQLKVVERYILGINPDCQ
jgi:LAS superfamily LD-carboxypeptidase LdcB